jgi:leader peptidase (prepilin peptidase)/N-methyltransferase
MDAGLRIAIALPLGLIFGSFLTVVVSRVPDGGSVVRPRSRCPACGTQIAAIDNIPVLSWIALRGRCRTCRASISPIYPALELVSAALFVAVALTVDEAWAAIVLAPFLGEMAAITVIDWRHRIIPNRLVYPSLAIVATYLVGARLVGQPVMLGWAAVGFLAYGGALLILALIAPGGMGMGDVKLASLVGLVLGSLGLRFVLVAAAAGVLAGGLAAVVALVRGASRKSGIPFGPAIAVGSVVAVFVGNAMAQAYLRTITG